MKILHWIIVMHNPGNRRDITYPDSIKILYIEELEKAIKDPRISKRDTIEQRL